MSIFKPVIASLTPEKPWIEPEAFASFRKKHGIKKQLRTADYLSVQTLEGLDPFLREHQLMVFRLGSNPGQKGGLFGIIRARNEIEDFFGVDSKLFKDAPLDFPVRDKINERMKLYSLLSKFNEETALDYCFNAGVITNVLGLDKHPEGGMIKTGTFTASFTFRPRADLDLIWHHQNGQVEIDGIFFGRRSGEPCLFVIEAKHGNWASISKAKMAYSCLAIPPGKLPEKCKIVPVYVKTIQLENSLTCHLAEFELNLGDNNSIAIDTIVPVRTSSFAIRLPVY